MTVRAQRQRLMRKAHARARRKMRREATFRSKVLDPFLKTFTEARDQSLKITGAFLPALSRRQRSLLRAAARRGIELSL